MKFNLKNKPKLTADPTTNEQKIVEWFEGFEKELREKLEYLKLKHWQETKYVVKLIEEILGER